jgi:predicted dehydrogenase
VKEAPLRLGIVGCGWVALERHLPALARVDEVDVVALADHDADALGRAAALVPTARPFESVAALSADPDVEAVAVCVPPTGHVDVALTALSKGKHVLVEKPLATTLEDADRLVDAAGASAGKVVVGFNFRRHRLVERARSLVSAGEVGDVMCIRSAFTNDVPLDDAARWRGTRALGGGGILDRAVHEFDLWRYLLSDDIAEVFAYSVPGRTDDDVAVVAARMRRGALATIVVLDSAAVSHELAVHGTRATIRLDLCRFDGFSVETIGSLPGSPRTRIRRAKETLADPRGNARAIRRGGDAIVSYEDEWRAFATIVRLDLPSEPSVADGRAALEAALAAVESAGSGSPVGLRPLIRT